MFSRIVPLKSTGSCGTVPMARRRSPSARLPDVDAVEQYRALLDIPEARQQRRDRRLAGARRAHQRHHLARPDVQREMLQRRRRARSAAW